MNPYKRKANKILNHITPLRYFLKGRGFIKDKFNIDGAHKNVLEKMKRPFRTDIINYLLALSKTETTYLEIGVRDPRQNFDKINAHTKYSVDPGVEFKENPVDFKLTSDEFFEQLSKGKILDSSLKFDVIFIDGLHLADQVDRDIENALQFLKPDGFVVLHDCNPPTEWHARSEYGYSHSPVGGGWNGTTWKAFFKWRQNPAINSCCIDTDWGVGILSKSNPVGKHLREANQFYEYRALDENRKDYLNLISFEELKGKLEN